MEEKKKRRKERLFLIGVSLPVALSALAMALVIVHVGSAFLCSFVPKAKKKENAALDTTAEKQWNQGGIQIVNGKLYYEDQNDSLEKIMEYDYASGNKRQVLSEYCGDYCVFGDWIYYGTFKDNIRRKSLTGDGEKETVLDDVEDFVFSGEDVIYVNELGGVFRYPLSGDGEQTRLLTLNGNNREYMSLIYCWGNILVFEKATEDNDKKSPIHVYNTDTHRWTKPFQVEGLPENYYFRISEMACMEQYLFVQGDIWDMTKKMSEDYEVKDTGMDGLWKIDVTNGELVHLTTKEYTDLKVLNKKLYGESTDNLLHIRYRYEEIDISKK